MSRIIPPFRLPWHIARGITATFASFCVNRDDSSSILLKHTSIRVSEYSSCLTSLCGFFFLYLHFHVVCSAPGNIDDLTGRINNLDKAAAGGGSDNTNLQSTLVVFVTRYQARVYLSTWEREEMTEKEVRALSCQLGCMSRCDGSAQLGQGSTTVMVSVLLLF